MNIIFGKENADLLRDRYLLLDLETFELNGQSVDCYCLIETENLPPGEYVHLEQYKKMHTVFVNNFKSKNYQLCKDLLPHLYSKFGGQVDSFYTVISEKLEQLNSNNS